MAGKGSISQGRIRVAALLGLTGVLVASATAQAGLNGYHQYPQFRTMSGLPGSSFPVSPRGEVEFSGAIALSTPVAYSLANSRFVVGLMAVSFGHGFDGVFSRRGEDLVRGDGTGQALAGIGLGKFGNLTVGALVLSGQFDTAFNFHYAPPQPRDKKFGYAIGVQDVAGKGGSSGGSKQGSLPGDTDSSTSVYGVVTGEISKETYLSLGYGSHRFKRPFGNISTSVAPGIKAYAEYDAFNWNLGLSGILLLGRPSGNIDTTNDHRSSLTLSFGLVRAKYPAISANFAF